MKYVKIHFLKEYIAIVPVHISIINNQDKVKLKDTYSARSLLLLAQEDPGQLIDKSSISLTDKNSRSE